MVFPPLISLLVTAPVVLAWSWGTARRRKLEMLGVLTTGAAVHWILLNSLQWESLSYPVAGAEFYVCPAGASWGLWACIATSALWVGSQDRGWTGLARTVEVLLALATTWTGVGVIFLVGKLLVSGPLWGEGWTLSVLLSLASAPASSLMMLLAFKGIHRLIAARRNKILATALLALWLLCLEPAAWITGATVIGDVRKMVFLREHRTWVSADALGLSRIPPDTPVIVEATDLFGLVRYFMVADVGGGWRVVSVRGWHGWLPIRWIVVWE